MNANITSAASFAGASGTAHAFYFKSGERELFTWLHEPVASNPSDLGVVICNPFGYESICAHRSVRDFAETMAVAGIPALRFDYCGSGDSAEHGENADITVLWTQDTIAAIHELRRRTGVRRVCLLGIRLGAMFATLAATESGLVDSLILVGPVVSGRRFVRDLKMTQLAGGVLSAGAEAEVRRTSVNGLEAGGFLLPEASVQSLMQLDLQAAAAPQVRSILIIDNDKLPSAKRWADALMASVQVDYRSMSGLIEMAMTAPQFAVSPRAMIEGAKNWLAAAANTTARGAADAANDQPGPPLLETLRLQVSGSLDDSITENPVLIPARTPLFGIVTMPKADERRRRAVILLNPGADFHIGASRMYVSLARRWARRGYLVLRMDLDGIGDSATQTGSKDDEVFPHDAIDDIRCAVEFLRTRYEIVDMTLAGLCSGAYHALRAAVAGAQVNKILMVNPQNYFWDAGMTLDQLQLAEVVHNPGVYKKQVLSLRAWRRFLTGKINIARIGLVYLQRLRLASEALLRDSARRIGLPMSRDLGHELRDIVARGIRVTFVFARGEPGLELLKLQSGATAWQLGDRCQVRIVDSGDHIFSRIGPRTVMEGLLSDELFARAAESEPAVALSRPELHATDAS